MAIPRGLAQTILKYRRSKRRPLSPTIPSYAGQCSSVRPVTRIPGDTERAFYAQMGSTHESYMDGSPSDYLPHPGFMEIPESDYGSFGSEFTEDFFQMNLQRFEELQHIAPVTREFDFAEHIKYEDCLMSDDLFEHQLQLLNLQLEQDLVASLDIDIQEVGFDVPAIEAMSLDQIIEAQMPDIFEGHTAEAGMVFDEPGPDSFFMEEQNLEAIIQEQSLSAPQIQKFMDHVMMFDNIAFDMGMPSVVPNPMEYDADMMADEINQAVDQVTGQPMPQEAEMEPDPMQMQYGPDMTPGYMLCPQDMPGSIMPGPMPMGPVPINPGFMPDAGPSLM